MIVVRFTVVLLILGPFSGMASGSDKLLRQPDIHADTVVFVCGEDLWRGDVSGGDALRLTSHDGRESFPRFSRDGTHIAFTAEYDGNTDVYVMKRDGSDIRRMTFHPTGDYVVGWCVPKGKILFRSNRRAYSRFDRLYLISPDGTGLEEIPLHHAAWGSFSPDGTKIAYNRVAREQRTWKRYVGGLAQDIRVFDFETGVETIITDHRGTDRLPIWIGEKIYFTSDRKRQLNLFEFDVSSGKTAQVTRFDNYDVRFPSSSDGHQIAFELGGELYRYDVESGESTRLDIRVPIDSPEVRPFIKDVSDQVRQVALSPNGKRALVQARGEIFDVPLETGVTRNVSRDSGARDKDPVWSPDGRSMAYVSDRMGEYDIYVVDSQTHETPEPKTNLGPGYRHTLRWSPDGKKIAFADQTLRFFLLDVESGRVQEGDRSSTEPVDIGIDYKPIHDYQFSPDSRYVAYSKIDSDLVSRVYLLEIETLKVIRVSGDLFNDFGPTFSRDGKRLFFVSNRRFDPTFCDFEWEMVYKDVAGLYAVTLSAKDPPFMALMNDEGSLGDAETTSSSAKKDFVLTRVDEEGIRERIEALPVPRGNYRSLSATSERLYFLNGTSGDFNRFEYRALGPRSLEAYAFESRKTSTIHESVESFSLSAGFNHLIHRAGSTVGVISTKGVANESKPLSLTDLKMKIDPRQEWQQIFSEAWRMERDFYYEPSMHGIDWNQMRQKYGSLLERASSREDVRYLIGELIGELNTSHTYAIGGEQRRIAESISVGLLGADVDLDGESNRYRFSTVYRDADWTRGVYPPLAQPGQGVREGEYLIAVDGEEVTGDSNFYSYFQDKANQQVVLTINDVPSEDGARHIRVQTLGSERALRYCHWLESNRKKIDELSDGQIGYLHLPDTYLGSAVEFPKYFYGQTQKKGLIVDGRFNGGGLDPDIFLQRIGKRPMAFWTRRYSMEQTTPAVTVRAHLACLTNRQAGSGGDMLPMEFQMKKLGPVIGTRTWGGLVGVSMFYELVDGGSLTAPDYRIYTPEGKWIVENEGVSPDIEVDLSPSEMMRGEDAQIKAAVDYLLKKIRDEPINPPIRPVFPDDGQ